MDNRLLHAKAAIVPSDDFQVRTLARLQRQAVPRSGRRGDRKERRAWIWLGRIPPLRRAFGAF